MTSSVILIHGLQDDPDKVFRNHEGDSVWVCNELMDYIGWGLLWFRYDNSSSDAPVFSEDGLDILARQLLDGLIKLREKRKNEAMVTIFFPSPAQCLEAGRQAGTCANEGE